MMGTPKTPIPFERRYSDAKLAELSGEAAEEISPRALVLLELEIRRTLALEAIAAALKEIGG